MTAPQQVDRHAQVLGLLAAHGEATAARLAELMDVHASRAVQVLRQLRDQGLVQRRRAHDSEPWRWFLIGLPPGRRDELMRLIGRAAWVEVTGPTGARWAGRLVGLQEHPTITLDTGGRALTLPAHYPVRVLPMDGQPVPVTRERLIAALTALEADGMPLVSGLEARAIFADLLLARLQDGA